MSKKVAFIGSGVMAGAILKGACRALDPTLFLVTDKFEEKAQALAEEVGARAVPSNREAVEQADYIFLCVKPQVAAEVLEELAPVLGGTSKVLCSILAGVTIESLRAGLRAPTHPVIRIMPNTSALIGKGQMLLASDEQVSEQARGEVLELLAPCGSALWLPEQFFDQGTALSGSSPAFVYMFIEAMADAGVEAGLSRAQAIELSARAVYGAAAMVLETGSHPAVLKDMVCSPGGMTIAGVSTLEDQGFRKAVINAIRATCLRSKELGKLS